METEDLMEKRIRLIHTGHINTCGHPLAFPIMAMVCEQEKYGDKKYCYYHQKIENGLIARSLKLGI